MSRSIPPGSAAPEAQWGEQGLRARRKRLVLLVGEVPLSLRSTLDQRGAQLVLAAGVSDAFELLAAHTFDVVVVEPHTDACARDFINALKEPADAHEHTIATLYGAPGQSRFLRGVRAPALERLQALRATYAYVPFVLLPVQGDPHYAVIVKPPELSELRKGRVLPVETTIMTVSAQEFLKGSTALA
ncbi:MAG: hypothetical protein GQE15_34515 [Archangiaceae bacterium]|nr:hypothetical protein [Archangiaceae bacterium]